LDDDARGTSPLEISVASAGQVHAVSIPPNYGQILVTPPLPSRRGRRWPAAARMDATADRVTRGRTHDPSLQNKRALVTGGSRGIGAAIVKRLARDGAHVALTYVSKPDQANDTATAAQALGVRALAIQADSANPAAVPLPWSERSPNSAASTFSSTTPVLE